MDTRKLVMKRVTTVHKNIGNGLCETTVTTETGRAEDPVTIVEITTKNFEENKGWGFIRGTYRNLKIWGVTLKYREACAKGFVFPNGRGQYAYDKVGLDAKIFGRYEGNDYVVIHETYKKSRFVDFLLKSHGEYCQIETSDSDPAIAHGISEMLYYRRKWAREAAKS